MEKRSINYDNVGKKIGKGISSEVYEYQDDKGIKLSDIYKTEQINNKEIQLFSKGGY